MTGIWIILFIAALLVSVFAEVNKRSKMSVGEKRGNDIKDMWGILNPALICPHCQEKGQVRTKSIKRKKGISGSKATGAILTGGVSILATGLSRKESTTQAHCDNCNSTWDF